MGGLENKLLIFADEILVLISDPQRSVAPTLDLATHFQISQGIK